jgi:hypothetical protein
VITRILAALCLTALIGAPLAAAPAAAQSQSGDTVMSGITGERLVEILEEQGFEARVVQDQFGDPLILASAAELKFTIWTYGCGGAPKSCNQLQFLAEFALPDGQVGVEELAVMNEFNRKKRFGRASVQPEGSATVDYTINLDRGVTQDNLVSNMVVWTNVLIDFAETVGWRSVSA